MSTWVNLSFLKDLLALYKLSPGCGLARIVHPTDFRRLDNGKTDDISVVRNSAPQLSVYDLPNRLDLPYGWLASPACLKTSVIQEQEHGKRTASDVQCGSTAGYWAGVS
jgi:hypothetical protein